LLRVQSQQLLTKSEVFKDTISEASGAAGPADRVKGFIARSKKQRKLGEDKSCFVLTSLKLGR
jgi:hypothetical protein